MTNDLNSGVIENFADEIDNFTDIAPARMNRPWVDSVKRFHLGFKIS